MARSVNNDVLQQERLLLAVTHDLRTPLLTIQAYLAGLESAARNQQWEQFRDDIQAVGRVCERMRRLISQLQVLRWTSEESNESTAVDVRRAMMAAVEQVFVERHEVKIRSDLAPVYTVIDEIPLVQIFQNLLRNAQQAVAHLVDRQIVVRLRAKNGAIFVQIRDNGRGMTPEQCQALCQLQAFPAEEGRWGIGLLIVRRLLSAFGGRMQVSSPGLNLGTKVRLILPRSARAV